MAAVNKPSSLETSGLEHNIDKFKASVELLAKMLSEQHQVDVVFEGTTCATDGKMIILPDPSLLEFKSMDVEKREHALAMLRALQGTVNHEAAHVLFTRVEDGEKAHKAEGPLAKAMHNIVEDVRIEKLMAKRWTNAGYFFDTKNEWAIKERIRLHGLNPEPPVSQLLVSILWAARHGIDSPEAKTFGDDIQEILRILQPEIEVAAKATTQDEAYDAAIAITKKLKEIIPPQDQPQDEPEEDEEGEGGEGEEGEDEGDGNAQGDEDGDEGDEGDGGADDGDGEGSDSSSGGGKPRKPPKGKKPSRGNGGEGDDSDDGDDGDSPDERKPGKDKRGSKPRPNGNPQGQERDANDGDPRGSGKKPPKQKPGSNKSRDSLRGIHDPATLAQGTKLAADNTLIEGIFQNIDPSKVVRKYRVFSNREDQVGLMEATTNLVTYSKLLERARRDVGVVKRGVQAYLMAQQEAVWVGDRERGRLDTSALYKLVQSTGTHVFKEKTRAKTFKGLGIELLINLSGSMSHNAGGYTTRLEMAKYVAIIFGEVLDSLGVPFEIHGHSAVASYQAGERARNMPNNVRELYARWSPLVFKTVKRFDDPYKSCRTRLASLAAIGNTFDGEAIEIAAKRVAGNKKVERRIIISLDDGIPEPTSVEQPKIQDHRLNLKTQVERAEKAGIQVIGVGMGVDEVKHYYKNTIVIHDEKQTAAILTKRLRELLMQSK